MKRFSKVSLTSAKDIDLELYVVTEILHLESLHYGYWRSNENLTLTNLKKAQSRYTDTLITWFPKEVKTILDVGSGIGDVARALTKRGLRVTAISPDVVHAKYYDNKQPRLTFFNTTFESFTTLEQFDLILMSESQNYFTPQVGFQKCTKLLRPGGYLLVSGKFRQANSPLFSHVTNAEKDYLYIARRYGFTLVKSVDITKKILPTLELAHRFYQQYGTPIVKLITIYQKSLPFPYILLSRFILGILMRNQAKKAKDVLRLYSEHSQPRLFQKHVKYLRLLFRYQTS